MRSLFEVVRDWTRAGLIALEERFGDALDVPLEGDDEGWPS